MPKVSKEQVQYYISRIRSVMILAPDASLRTIQQALEASTEAPLHLDLGYIMRLRKKIYAERIHRNNNLNKSARIAYIQDKKKVLEQRLWSEATNMKNPGIVRVAALEKIMKNELELLKAEMDAGFFERKIGTLNINGKVEHAHTLAPEILEPIMKAFKNYGLVKIIEHESKNTPAALPEGASREAGANTEPAPTPPTAIPGV